MCWCFGHTILAIASDTAVPYVYYRLDYVPCYQDFGLRVSCSNHQNNIVLTAVPLPLLLLLLDSGRRNCDRRNMIEAWSWSKAQDRSQKHKARRTFTWIEHTRQAHNNHDFFNTASTVQPTAVSTATIRRAYLSVCACMHACTVQTAAAIEIAGLLYPDERNSCPGPRNRHSVIDRLYYTSVPPKCCSAVGKNRAALSLPPYPKFYKYLYK